MCMLLASVTYGWPWDVEQDICRTKLVKQGTLKNSTDDETLKCILEEYERVLKQCVFDHYEMIQVTIQITVLRYAVLCGIQLTHTQN